MTELFSGVFGFLLVGGIIWLAFLPLIALCYCWRYTRRTSINTERIIELLKDATYIDFVKNRVMKKEEDK